MRDLSLRVASRLLPDLHYGNEVSDPGSKKKKEKERERGFLCLMGLRDRENGVESSERQHVPPIFGLNSGCAANMATMRRCCASYVRKLVLFWLPPAILSAGDDWHLVSN